MHQMPLLHRAPDTIDARRAVGAAHPPMRQALSHRMTRRGGLDRATAGAPRNRRPPRRAGHDGHHAAPAASARRS